MNEAAVTRAEAVSIAARPPARRFLAAFGLTVALCVVTFYAALLLLRAVGRLPSPPISGTWCIDDKLAWLKGHPDSLRAGVIAVGSSVTWRNLDFSALSAQARTTAGGVSNVAPCYLRMNQTRFFGTFLLDRNPQMNTVLTVVAPRDFEECARAPSAFFDPVLATDYLFGDTRGWWLYFRNFRPQSFLESVARLPARRERELVYDAFGSGPLTSDAPLLWTPFTPEPECYRELAAMAWELQRRAVQFVVITLPVMPDWARRHDPAGVTRFDFQDRIRSALAGTDAVLIEGMRDYVAPTAAFTDPMHFQWSETARFTHYVWEEARRLGAKLPPARSPS